MEIDNNSVNYIVIIMIKNFLKYVDDCVVNKQNNLKKDKPDFYVVCPCCKTQRSAKKNPLNGVVSIFNRKVVRPFDSYQNENTIFDAVKDMQNDLTPAYQLYQGKQGKSSPYRMCYENNKGKMFCLSPAWGIVRADFCLPEYNVKFGETETTLTNDGDYVNQDWQKGMKNAFNHLKDVTDKTIPIVAFGNENYIKRLIFLKKSGVIENSIVVFTRNANIIEMCDKKKIDFVEAHTTRATNWYYDYMKII